MKPRSYGGHPFLHYVVVETLKRLRVLTENRNFLPRVTMHPDGQSIKNGVATFFLQIETDIVPQREKYLCATPQRPFWWSVRGKKSVNGVFL